MAHGNLVVATGYSGNMDYMDERNALPVNFSIETIRCRDTRMRFDFAGGEPRWAYIDENDLAEKLRLACNNWNTLANTRAAAKVTMAGFTAERITMRMMARLSQIANMAIEKDSFQEPMV